LEVGPAYIALPNRGGDEGNRGGGGVDSQARARMISFLEGGEEGWLGGLRNLGFLGSRDLPALVMLLEEMLFIQSAVGVGNGMVVNWVMAGRGAGCYRWLC